MTTLKLASERETREVMELKLMAEGNYEEAGILYRQYTNIPEPLGFWDKVKRFILPNFIEPLP
jgi:hypothetical protein